MAPQTQQTKKPRTRTAWQFACKDEDGTFSECGYLLRDHDLAQLVQFSKRHAKESHGVEAPEAYFQGAATKVTF
jgi:hypothetical protein